MRVLTYSQFGTDMGHSNALYQHLFGLQQGMRAYIGHGRLSQKPFHILSQEERFLTSLRSFEMARKIK